MASMWVELKRRNVVRVAIAYAVVSWLLLQVVDTVVPMLGLPTWIGPAILLFLAVGFVISMIFAWAFEITPEGVKREKDVDRTQSITHVTGRKLDFVIIGVLTIALAFFALDKFIWHDHDAETVATNSSLEKSIAVIPFANRSADESDAYFVDGIHDDILTQLSKLSGIDRVISRTSVERYRTTELSVPEIAAELGVATILEGSVQRAGDSVRITMQLIDAVNDEHIWADNFDRELTANNVFEIQSEISTAIATSLQAALTDDEVNDLAKLPTDSLAAWEKYQLGRYLMRGRTLENLARAREFFEEAIEIDEDFALAYVGLADANNMSAWVGLDSDEAMSLEDFNNLVDRAQAAAEQALEINPRLGEAYASLGYAQFNLFAPQYFVRADDYFRRAAELAPNYADTYRWHAQILWETPLNRPTESLALAERGVALDPMVSLNHVSLGEAYEINGRFELAAASFERALEIPPSNVYAIDRYVHFLRRQNEYSQAVAAGLNAIAADFQSVSILYSIARSYRQLGDMEEYLYWSDRVLRSGNTDQAPAMGATLALDDGLVESAIQQYEDGLLEYPHWEIIYSLSRAYLRNHQTAALLELIERYAPAILNSENAEDWPPQSAMLIAPAAWALFETGNQDRATKTIESGLNVVRTNIRQANFGYGIEIADIEMYALQGNLRRALDAFTSAVEDGYRNTEWLERSPFLDPIRSEREFIAAMDVIRADLAAQRSHLEAMERRGELPAIAR